jgi:hypothetical protein
VGRVHTNRGRVGEERGGKEMDICPLTAGLFSMPAGEDGDEDAPADGGSPGWNSRIV